MDSGSRRRSRTEPVLKGNTMNMIEQDLVIENRRGLDKIARRGYEQRAQLGADDRSAEYHIGAVVRGRIEQFLAALKHAKPVKTEPAAR